MRCVPAFILALSAAACRSAAPSTRPQLTNSVWWTTDTFPTSGDSVEGIPVQILDSAWIAARRLTRAMLPPDPQLANKALRFVVEGDFNHDGVRDRVVVGVYRTNVGAVGRFILFLTKRSGRWEKAQLGQERGTAGFSVLMLRHDTLSWYDCLECDFSIEFAWNGHEYGVVSPDSSRD